MNLAFFVLFMKNYLLAITTLMGTIIGVGIFALPYIVSKSGVILLFIYMPVLGTIQYFLHLHFAEIVLSTRGDHRLPGYVARYFGQAGKKVTLLISLLSDYGVIITYIIVGGLFAHQLFSPILGGSHLFYTVLIFLIEAFIVLYGLKIISGAEFAMTATLVIIMVLIIIKGLLLVDIRNFTTINWQNIFLPYGPVFFAVGGQAAIPEMCKLLKDTPGKIKSAIAWGTYLSAALMLVFVLVVTGVTGLNTTPDALAGLGNIFGSGIIRLALLFGLLVVATSMIVITQASREILWWDFGIDKNIAWALTCALPLWFYLIGVQNLTKTVSLTGAISGGVLGIVIIWLLLVVKKRRDQESAVKNYINRPMAYILSIFFILGFIYEVWNVFFNKI